MIFDGHFIHFSIWFDNLSPSFYDIAIERWWEDVQKSISQIKMDIDFCDFYIRY